MDLNTAEPLDALAPLARQALEQLGSHCTTVSGVISSRDQAVFTAITEGLERANKLATSNAQKVTNMFSVTNILLRRTSICMFMCKAKCLRSSVLCPDESC